MAHYSWIFPIHSWGLWHLTQDLYLFPNHSLLWTIPFYMRVTLPTFQFLDFFNFDKLTILQFIPITIFLPYLECKLTCPASLTTISNFSQLTCVGCLSLSLSLPLLMDLLFPDMSWVIIIPDHISATFSLPIFSNLDLSVHYSNYPLATISCLLTQLNIVLYML